jgi:hypothetical protein
MADTSLNSLTDYSRFVTELFHRPTVPSSRPGGVKRGVRYAKVATNIPDDLYKKIEEEVKLGMFSELKELENIRR